jgi:GT2 family glycosyltransferase/SAM-dependent methyltransferase
VTDFRPRRVVNVDLSEGLPELEAERNGRDLYVVFWWKDLALAHAELAPEQLSGPGLPHLVANLVAPAVGDLLFPTGFEGRDPHLPQLPREPAPALNELLALSQPLARLDERIAERDHPPERLSSSLVICTRNRPDQLRRCLDSIAAAAVAPEQVIVVDNAPANGSTRAVVEGRPGVRYVAEERPGLSTARNTGIEHAGGDVVVFVDDDTVVHRDWLWRLLEGFAEPEVMAVTGLVLPAELETEAQVAFEKALGGFNHGYQHMRYGQVFFESTKAIAVPVWKIGAGANMAVRRVAFEHVGTFDERLGAGATGCSEDSELWYRLLAAGFECRYQPTSIVFHYHRRDAGSLQRQARDYIRGHTAALFVQYGRYRHGGNLRRALLAMPRSFLFFGFREAAKRTFTALGIASYDHSGIYRAQLSGYARGLATFPLALSVPEQTHKAALGPYLAQNPFPHGRTAGLFYREKMRAIHAVAPDVPVRQILEVGGGQSGLTAMLYPRAEVTNVDVNEEFADSPINRDNPRIRFVAADATDLPFEGASFDAVTMFDLLEHVPDDRAAVSEALRVLRPGGYALVSSPNERWRFPYYRLFRPICPTDEDMIEEWGHVRRGYSLPELERLFGSPPLDTATFITPVTAIGHDVAFSKLPEPVRIVLSATLAPLTWAGYRLHRRTGPGTETASVWRKPG